MNNSTRTSHKLALRDIRVLVYNKMNLDEIPMCSRIETISTDSAAARCACYNESISTHIDTFSDMASISNQVCGAIWREADSEIRGDKIKEHFRRNLMTCEMQDVCHPRHVAACTSGCELKY